MGNFFSNIHIKKQDNVDIDSIKSACINLMLSNGYKLENKESNADGTITICSSKDSKWITVFSDLFELYNSIDFRKIYESLNIKSDFLGISCYDSDYLSLNLINDNENIDAWANVGSSYEIKNDRRTNFKDWKYKINNIEEFKLLIKKQYTFAEDFLECTNRIFELPTNQALIQEGIEIKEENFYKIYFSMPNDTNCKKNELPKLKIYHFDLVPCIPGELSCVSVYNVGGKSRGLSVVIFGDFVENGEITLSETYIRYRVGNEYKQIPIKFDKIQNRDGVWMYVWTDNNIIIPPKVNENLPLMKQSEIIFSRSFTVYFIPNGNNRKFLDIKVGFVPKKNPKEGQCVWYVWKSHNSKKDFLESTNKERLLNQPFGKPGNFPEDRLGIYNLDDYDLE